MSTQRHRQRTRSASGYCAWPMSETITRIAANEQSEHPDLMKSLLKHTDPAAKVVDADQCSRSPFLVKGKGVGPFLIAT